MSPSVTKQIEQQPEVEEKRQPSFRKRTLAYMAEGPHLSPEVAEQLRRDIRQAKEENLVNDIPA